MTMATGAGVLGRMTRRRAPDVPDVPLTASRAVRLAVERAAQATTGLTVTVGQVAELVLPLDRLLADCGGDMLLLALMRDGAVCGLIGCDAGLVSAQIEMLTTGRIAPGSPDLRPVTRTEGTLAQPLLIQILAEMEETTIRTALDGWMQGAVLGTRFDTPRAAGFELADQFYRRITLSLSCGDADRPGQLMLALPPQAGTAAVPGGRQDRAADRGADRAADWHDRFRTAVLAAPARLDAVLHRMTVPAAVLTAMDIGQILPLQGCTVGMVRLEDPLGRTVARGRLGQIGGHVAVRVQHSADTVPMVDLAMTEMSDAPTGHGRSGDPAAVRTIRTRATDSPVVQLDLQVSTGDPVS
ncbi:FliM/FliN family flagellar motor switch protein [Loktanella fryxellensis]|nr:flagellar motor switch protein FliM [Loktanella fryxellensis]